MSVLGVALALVVFWAFLHEGLGIGKKVKQAPDQQETSQEDK